MMSDEEDEKKEREKEKEEEVMVETNKQMQVSDKPHGNSLKTNNVKNFLSYSK